MNRPVAGIALLVALTAIPGCSVKPRIHVFNNSDERVIIHIGPDELAIEPDATVSFLYENDDLSVEIGESPILYQISGAPQEYIRTGWFRSHITLQVEPDRKVFVLRAQDRPPVVTASYPQPTGYPLVAISSNAPRG